MRWWVIGCATAPPAAVESAVVEPPVVRCVDGSCAVHLGGHPIGEPFDDLGDTTLTPLGPHAWLSPRSAGDGCPIVYAVLCAGRDQPVWTEPFGDCDEPARITRSEGTVELVFAGFTDAELGVDRPAQHVRIALDTCALERR